MAFGNERRASIESLARAAAQSPDGIAVLAWEGEFLYVNPAWVEMHGFSEDECLGHRIQDLYPGDQMARMAAETVRQLAQQDSFEIEVSHYRKDGTPFHAWVITTLLRDERGKANGFVLNARDITEWNRLKLELEEEKARLEQQHRRQQALASIELAINEPNELTAVLHRIVAVVTEHLPASGGASILLWDQAQESYSVSASSVSEQMSSTVQRRVREEGGATRWIIDNRQPVVVNDIAADPFHANPILREHGLHAYIGVPVLAENVCLGVLYALDKLTQDYTSNDVDFLLTLAARAGAAISKVQLYERLRETNLLLHNQATDLVVRNTDLDAFAHTVAHDLKNPLTSIIGYAEMLLDDYALLSDDERLEFLGYIAGRGQKMRQIVDELLLMSQISSREVPLVPVEMGPVLKEVCHRLDEVRRQRAAVIHLPECWPRILGYTPWLEEVWTNYLSNALKYGGSPPEVWFGSEAQADGFVRFWVKDNGAGLSEAQQSHLFQPFSRLHTGQEEGHGLGLSIVRRIVEKCGGSVGVESAPGAGSTFWFTLPQVEE